MGPTGRGRARGGREEGPTAGQALPRGPERGGPPHAGRVRALRPAPGAERRPPPTPAAPPRQTPFPPAHAGPLPWPPTRRRCRRRRASRRTPEPSSRGTATPRRSRATLSPTSPVRARSRSSASDGRAPSAARRTAATASADRAGKPSPRASSSPLLASPERPQATSLPASRSAETPRTTGAGTALQAGTGGDASQGTSRLPGRIPSRLRALGGKAEAVGAEKGEEAREPDEEPGVLGSPTGSSGRRRGAGAGPSTQAPPSRRPQVKTGSEAWRRRPTSAAPANTSGPGITHAGRCAATRSVRRLSPTHSPKVAGIFARSRARTVRPAGVTSTGNDEGRPVVPEAGIRLRDDRGRVERATRREREREDRRRHRHPVVVRRGEIGAAGRIPRSRR